MVDVLRQHGPLRASALSTLVGSRAWGPGRFRGALRSGLASGRIRRLGPDRYAASQDGEGVQAPSGHRD
jgi:hypothetical protein